MFLVFEIIIIWTSCLYTYNLTKSYEFHNNRDDETRYLIKIIDFIRVL